MKHIVFYNENTRHFEVADTLVPGQSDAHELYDSLEAAQRIADKFNRTKSHEYHPSSAPSESSDFDSGFGIGGISSEASLDQQAYDEAQMQIAALDRPERPKRKHSGTRYEENCERCGRFSFEICNTCGGCNRCCPGES